MLIDLHLAAKHTAFCTVLPCVLHQNALHLASKRTVFCGIYGLCTNLWKPKHEELYPCHSSQSSLENLCLWIERLGECVCCPAHKEVEHTAIMLVWGRCNCVETLQSQVADLLCQRVKDSLYGYLVVFFVRTMRRERVAMALCVEHFCRSIALIVCLESGILPSWQLLHRISQHSAD